ncbi:MAG: transglycosylase SLT domain-containing protein, partial [Pseudomonadota bacterium]
TMRRDPDSALKRIGRVPNHALRDKLYIYGVKRAARKDPANAYKLMARTVKDADLTDEDIQSLLDYVAIRGARKGLPEVDDWVDELKAPSDDLSRWRVRSALTRGDWPAVQAAIDAMPAKLKGDGAWRYFEARALEARGSGAQARQLYEALAEERSYYGFLAADRLETSYQFGHRTLTDDPAVQTELAAREDIQRIRELFEVDQFGLARSEWERAVRGLDRSVRQQAALMADRWGWHSQAIRTLAYSGGRDDLMRTYPTPFKEDYDEHASRADIARTWAYSVTRAESLFMSDVKSSAGAVGLMQLLPGTGKETARRARVPYRGLASLLDPQTNITLGVHYLGQMYKRFDEHQVLATAAYNAGPRRVRSWLPERGNVPADIWIETIPFNETRNYVQKVLFADTVFHWRLTGSERRLASRMPPIRQLD